MCDVMFVGAIPMNPSHIFLSSTEIFSHVSWIILAASQSHTRSHAHLTRYDKLKLIVEENSLEDFFIEHKFN